MEISVEISFYPLIEQFRQPVDEFIGEIVREKKIVIEPGKMSSVITGEYVDVMKLIERTLKPFTFAYTTTNTAISN